jgi:hypothetical protein
VASVSSAHEWRPKAGSQTSSATFRPWAIKVLPQRLRHLGSEATALACHAAGPKGPTIPDDGFGGASNAFHTRRVTRRHGRATRTTAWAPRPERDKHYLLVHVILTGLTGCAHPERVRGVTCDQPGPRIPQNRSLTSAARANDASKRSNGGLIHAAQISAPTHPPREMGNLGVILLYRAHSESATPPVSQHFPRKLHPTAGADIIWHSHVFSTTYQ